MAPRKAKIAPRAPKMPGPRNGCAPPGGRKGGELFKRDYDSQHASHLASKVRRIQEATAHSADPLSFGPSLGLLGPSWGLLELLGDSRGALGAILGPLEAILGPSWALLGPSWGLLGPSCDHLGASWGYLGGSLETLLAVQAQGGGYRPLYSDMRACIHTCPYVRTCMSACMSART